MTVAGAIAAADSLRPNSYTAAEKTAWLYRLDAGIVTEVTSPSNPDAVPAEEDYTGSCVLPVGPPYDEMYVTYLVACIHLADGEMTRYNNALLRFNDTYESFVRWYRRNYPPTGKELRLK